MNKNEPIIINKAGTGYIVKPLSYMFHDEGEETFLAFSNITELAKFQIEHFETESGGAHIQTHSKPLGEALSEELTKQGKLEQTKNKGDIVSGQQRTKPRSTPKVKK